MKDELPAPLNLHLHFTQIAMWLACAVKAEKSWFKHQARQSGLTLGWGVKGRTSQLTMAGPRVGKPFLLSAGDPSGFRFHLKFHSGWEARLVRRCGMDITLQQAMKSDVKSPGLEVLRGQITPMSSEEGGFSCS